MTDAPSTDVSPDTPSADGDSRPHYLDHRQRLRERFRSGGLEPMAEHERLELLLFLAIPRRDVKPLAKDLIKRFGSYANVLTADEAALLAVPGVGEAVVHVLKLVPASAVRLLRDEVAGRPVLSSWDKLLDYCHAAMAYGRAEEFRLLFLDRKNVLIADEAQQKGTVDHAPVYPREVAKRALDLGATALIMVHNHPSGDPTPSRADIEMTREVSQALAVLGITLHDHVVIARRGHYSFKSNGLL